MNIVAWKCHGACSLVLPSIMKDFQSIYGVHFVALLETCVSGTKASKVIRLSGFDRSYIIKANGFLGGTWCLWNKS